MDFTLFKHTSICYIGTNVCPNRAVRIRETLSLSLRDSTVIQNGNSKMLIRSWDFNQIEIYVIFS